MKKYIFSVLMLMGLIASAQTTKITFDTEDYKAVSVYDNWVNSPFRLGTLQGNAKVVDNPNTAVDPTLGEAPNATAKVVALERSRYGSNTFGVRIDLKEPFRMTKELQYIHIMALLKDKPVASRMMVIGLGKRVEDEWAWQDGTDEQFWALTNSNVKASNGWQDVVCSFKGFSYSKTQKPDNGIDIYSLVIVPDVSSPSCDMDNWAAYFDQIVIDNSASKRFMTDKYATTFDKETKVTRTDRHLDGVGLTSGYGEQTISGLKDFIYNDKTQEAVFAATAGESVTPKIIYTGTWMSGYAYADWNSNGVFETDELLGKTGTGNSIGNPLPAFVVPAATVPGFYRMRYKVDWNETDAKGAETLVSNGGGVTDVTLDVHEASVLISQNQLNGDICLNDGQSTKISNYEHPYGSPLTVKIEPEKGFVQNGFTIRYGYNIQAEDQFDDNGNPNYIEVSIAASEINADSTFEIPGEYLRGKNVLLMGDMQQERDYTIVVAGAPEGSGAVVYGGVDYKNGDVIKASQFFKADDVSPKEVDGYVVKSIVLDGYTLTLTYAQIKTGHRVSALSQLSNSKAYFIHSKNNEGYLCYNGDVTTQYVSLRGMTDDSHGTGNQHYKDEVDPFNLDNSWQLLKDGDKYYMYNVGQKKFVTRSGRDYYFTDEMVALDGIRNNGDGTFGIHAGGDMSDASKNFACICTGEATIALRNWTYSDHGSVMYITENPNIEVDDIFADFINVTYNYYYNGELKGSETIKTKMGNFFPEPTELPDFTTCSLPTENVTADVEKNIEVKAATPFEAADTPEAITTWYNVAIKGNYYWDVNTDGKTIAMSTETPIPDNDYAKWAFVGNPFDGYYIYSGKLGGAVLTSAINVSSNTGGSTYPIVQPLSSKTTSQVNHWAISRSSYATNGFFIAQDGYPSSILNLRDGKLAYWTGGADAGSTITVEEVGEATAIDQAPETEGVCQSATYDLEGRKVNPKTAKGVLIVDGQKVLK